MTISQKRAIGYAIRAREEKDRRTFIESHGMTDAFKAQKRYRTTRGFIAAIFSGRIIIDPITGLAVTPRNRKRI